MKFPFASILALAAAQMTQVDAIDDANSIRGIRSSGVDYAAAGVGRIIKVIKGSKARRKPRTKTYVSIEVVQEL